MLAPNNCLGVMPRWPPMGKTCQKGLIQWELYDHYPKTSGGFQDKSIQSHELIKLL